MYHRDILYLDYNATTPLKDEAKHSIKNLLDLPLNASSIHQYGKTAKKIIKDTKQQLKEILNLDKEKIIFCSSGSEANNLAIKGIKSNYVVTSSIEHLSVIKPAQTNKKHFICPVDDDGLVDDIALAKILMEQGKGGLVCIMLANNETGVIQQAEKISDICKKHKCFWFADSVQAFSKINLDYKNLNASAISISGHKLGASTGIAALILDKEIELSPLIEGGSQEGNLRAGTENILAISSLSSVLTNLKSSISFYQNELKSYQKKFESDVKVFAPDVAIHSENVNRLPNTTCISMPKVSSVTQLIAFDLAGIAVSAGSACSSGKVESSHVLKAMGVDSNYINCTIRVSTGFNTKKEDLEKLLKAWCDLYKRTRQ